MIFSNPNITSMEVLRIIHPIGQGAFYTEELAGNDGHKANVVFDCGTTTQVEKNILLKEVLSWQRGNGVDLLFIFHFDDDHVNSIGVLMHTHPIDRVVIPQILGFEWFWFLEDASQSKAWGNGHQINERLFDFIRPLARQRSIRIIEVAPMGDEPWKYETLYEIGNRRNRDGDNQDDFPIGLGRSQVVGSGHVINPKDVKAWEYVPFNYTMGKDIDKEKRQQHLEERIGTIRLCIYRTSTIS